MYYQRKEYDVSQTCELMYDTPDYQLLESDVPFLSFVPHIIQHYKQRAIQSCHMEIVTKCAQLLNMCSGYSASFSNMFYQRYK